MNIFKVILASIILFSCNTDIGIIDAINIECSLQYLVFTSVNVLSFQNNIIVLMLKNIHTIISVICHNIFMKIFFISIYIDTCINNIFSTN